MLQTSDFCIALLTTLHFSKNSALHYKLYEKNVMRNCSFATCSTQTFYHLIIPKKKSLLTRNSRFRSKFYWTCHKNMCKCSYSLKICCENKTGRAQKIYSTTAPNFQKWCFISPFRNFFLFWFISIWKRDTVYFVKITCAILQHKFIVK